MSKGFSFSFELKRKRNYYPKEKLISEKEMR